MVAASTRLSAIPTSEAEWKQWRTAHVTSTESSALFGMSPYATKFQLWHQKRAGEIVEIPENERMTWGKRLQNAIGQGIAEDHGIIVEPMPEYAWITGSRMGASFDFKIVGIASDSVSDLAQAFRQHGPGLLEIKAVDYLLFRDGWQDGDNVIPPDHIETQLQHQMHVEGLDWGAIGVLVSGHTPHIVIRQRDREAGAAIESAIVEFWRTVEAGEEPEPQFPVDASFYCKLHRDVSAGAIYDGRGDVDLESAAAQYRDAADREKRACEDKETAKAIIYSRVGAAERALLDNYKLWVGFVEPTHVPAHSRAGFRSIRLTPAKKAS